MSGTQFSASSGHDSKSIMRSVFHKPAPGATNHFMNGVIATVQALLILGLFLAPAFVAWKYLESNDRCASAQVAPEVIGPRPELAKAKLSTLALDNYGKNDITRSLASAWCQLSANGDRVAIAQSPKVTDLESSVNEKASEILGQYPLLYVAFGIGAPLSVLCNAVRRNNPKVKATGKGEVPVPARIVLGLGAGLLLAVAIANPGATIDKFNQPNAVVMKMTTSGSLDTTSLDESMYRDVQIRAFSEIMYGFDRPAEVAKATPHVDAYFRGLASTKKEATQYTGIYNGRVAKEEQKTAMKTQANEVRGFATGINLSSGMLSTVVNFFRPFSLMVLMITSTWFAALVLFNARKSLRYIAAWAWINAIPLMFLALASSALSIVNLKAIEITEHGWKVAGYGFFIVGALFFWILLVGVMLYAKYSVLLLSHAMSSSGMNATKMLGERMLANETHKQLGPVRNARRLKSLGSRRNVYGSIGASSGRQLAITRSGEEIG